jgi:hypothetical protein
MTVKLIDVPEAPTSRGHFLRQLTTMVGVGLGVGLAAAKPARAFADQCCPDDARDLCPPCSGGLNDFVCGGPCGGPCCICTSQEDCFPTTCPCP